MEFIFEAPDWCSYKPWKIIFEAVKTNVQNVLEIGSFEGRSMVKICEQYPECHFFSIDPYMPDEEYDTDINKVKKNMEHNASIIPNHVNLYCMYSKDGIEMLKGKKFDFIYIDGSHKTEDVYNDSKSSFEILNSGGYILFDDYDWERQYEGKNVKEAVDKFSKEYNLIPVFKCETMIMFRKD